MGPGFRLLIHALFVLAGASAPATAQAETLDPDGVERFVEDAEPWIASFKAFLGGAEAPAVAADVDIAAPAAESVVRTEHGRLVIERLGATSTATGSFDGLRASILGGLASEEVGRAKVKVVGVEGATEDGATLTCLVEMAGVGEPPSWQVQARVSLSLERLGDDPADILAVGVLAEGIERVRSSAPLFIERTAAVIGEERVRSLLGVGSDRWAQRQDDPALSSWFGHQGLAAGDLNGDGFDDLYVAMPSGIPNVLLMSQPDGTAQDEGPASGLGWLDDTKGVLLVDMDRDGDLDAVSAVGHVLVVQSNDGKGRFEVSSWAVAPDEAPFYGIDAADVNGDGWVDLFGARYVATRYADTVPVPLESARNGPSNHLFMQLPPRGNGRPSFRDVTRDAGLFERGLEASEGRFSLQGTFVDFDRDGDPDLYVVNDFGPNQLYVNEGGRFVESAETLGVTDQGAGMGASWADVDGDGHLDLYVTNMYSSAGRRIAYQKGFGDGRGAAELDAIRRLAGGNSLFLGTGKGFVRGTDADDPAGVRMGRWAWGAIFTDLDGDGREDIVSPSGFLTGPKPGDL